jgi:hypothetical protein
MKDFFNEQNMIRFDRDIDEIGTIKRSPVVKLIAMETTSHRVESRARSIFLVTS